MTKTAGWICLALALLWPTSLLADPFQGREPKEVLTSDRSPEAVVSCIVGAGVPAYPIKLEDGPKRVVFMSNAQTMSGRNIPLWRLQENGSGSRIEIYDMRRQFRRARVCFSSPAER